ncbi:MAG TPA: aminotransferase class V-fold PLP-dependent enzyme [Thermoanaerobaculia bacterium]|jgi:selenocysteine lyase/cysteine desulfurase
MLTELREREFARLGDHAYLDYTGAGLYGASQLRAHQALLASGVFGNPHSDSEASRASSEILENARRRVLEFFDVDESTHDVVFTANTTAAIKLVAESYPFSAATSCVLSADNHNSVNGIREYARRASAPVRVLPLDHDLRLDHALDHLGDGPGLLAFPAQSNFSGVRHPLTLVAAAQSRGFDVLLDVAAFVPSHALSLHDCPADFVALSFYKLFGYPTGVGALIARRESLAKLRRPWFSGGTIEYVSVANETHELKAGHEAFEDGTTNFLAVAALEPGFALLDEVKMLRLSAHVCKLTHILLGELAAMPHVTIYGPPDCSARGGTVAFNVDGVPYTEVERRAREAGVSLRGGCFCNPGAAEHAFGFVANTKSKETFGAVRMSVGLANTCADVERGLDVIAAFAARKATIAV